MHAFIFILICLSSTAKARSVNTHRFKNSAPSIDSTKDEYRKAKWTMYFKKNWDFRNAAIEFYSKITRKESDSLKLPEKIAHYQRVFHEPFNDWNPEIWSKGQPWGRFHPDHAYQFYGDPQVFVNNGYLHLLNQAQPHPILLKDQSAADQFRLISSQQQTNSITPYLVKTGFIDAQGQIFFNSEAEANKELTIMSFTTSDDSTHKKAIVIPYSVGVANTFHSKSFTYGFFAIRSKNPAGPATWPAWWLTGKNNWPPEIDIFEMYGGKTGNGVHTQTMTVHTGKVETHTKEMMMKKIRLSADTDTAFHIYACLWTKNRIEFYTDNVRVKSIKLNRWMSQFYQEPMYLILNNALENKYIPELISNGNKTTDFLIDWVQVYQTPNLSN